MNLEDKGHIQWGFHVDEMVGSYLKIIGKFHLGFVIDFSAEFHPDRCQPVSLFNQMLHDTSVVQILVIKGVGVDVRVPRHPQQGFGDNTVAAENLGQEMEDQLL